MTTYYVKEKDVLQIVDTLTEEAIKTLKLSVENQDHSTALGMIGYIEGLVDLKTALESKYCEVLL